jgi:tetratricopeptide (TPR) repeat protein
MLAGCAYDLGAMALPDYPSNLSHEAPEGSSKCDQVHALANDWVNRGMFENEKGRLVEALVCFDEAIRLRLELPFQHHPWFRWGLTAGWMNRAEVLVRMEKQAEALKSWDEALHHLMLLPLEMEPAFRWRLGLAWMNRGLSLQALGRWDEAMVDLDLAAGTLQHSSMKEVRDRGTLGCVWLNRARLLLEMDRLDEARRDAELALECLGPLEVTNSAAALSALHVRHVWAQAVAQLLERGTSDMHQADAWIHAATDLVEESLTRVQAWRSQGVSLGELPAQLFHFGCRIYLAYQPHFLGEFMMDVLRPDASRTVHEALEDVAEEVLQTAALVLRKRGLADLGLTRADDLLVMLEKLAEAGRVIRIWRQERLGETQTVRISG